MKNIIPTSEVIRHAKIIKDFCKELDCIECPFYGYEEKCIFMSFVPADWTDRTFKLNSKPTS